MQARALIGGVMGARARALSGASRALGDYYDGGFNAALKKGHDAVANGNLMAAQAKQQATKTAGAAKVQSAVQFLSAATAAVQEASAQASSTDWSQSQTAAADQTVASAAISILQQQIGILQSNIDSAVAVVDKLPGGGPPPPKKCPDGQILDAHGNCVPAPPPPPPPESSSYGWIAALLGLGLGIGILAVSQKKKRARARAHG